MLDLGSEMMLEEVLGTHELQTRASVVALTTAELAECNCPEFCERDHDVD